MHTRLSLIIGIVAASVVFTVAAALAQGPQPAGVQLTLTSTGFRYQGQLKQNGVPVSGLCDFGVSLWDAPGAGAPPTGGNQIGASEQWVNHTVDGGLFAVSLATSPGGFNANGNAFNGEDRWLQIQVRCPAGTGTYQMLSPRQRIYPAPYALALPGLRTQQHITSPMVIGGHVSNTIAADAVGATIAGGGTNPWWNSVDTQYGAIGGGMSNTIQGGGFAGVIGGGAFNRQRSTYGTIGGGQANRSEGDWYSTVGGGCCNTASGFAATVPGGQRNIADGYYSFAAGYRANALHDGSFVWNSGMAGITHTSTISEQFVVNASNGISLPVNAGGGKKIAVGERYRDNALVAWGRVSAAGVLEREFGVASLVKGTAGVYTITLDVTAEGATALVPIAVPELEALPTSAAGARHAFLNQVSANSFAVYITRGDWVADDNDFVFMVTAR